MKQIQVLGNLPQITWLEGTLARVCIKLKPFPQVHCPSHELAE